MKILFVFGTRPEAIKMAPLIIELKKRPLKFEVKVCITGQHRQMLDQVLSFFNIAPDFDCNLMQPDQTLFDVTASGLKRLEKVLSHYRPDLLFVQGDTTSAFIGALAAYYRQIKVAHLEAGLRSGKKYSPFPEEINRILVGNIADYHFAPTVKAVKNLKHEGIIDHVWNVGNTVVDALFAGLKIIKKEKLDFTDEFRTIDFSKRLILITCHRRESFGKPFKNICRALKDIASAYNDVELIYPVHLNPNVRKPVNEILRGQKNIHLLKPLDYPRLIWLMKKSYLVLTDSGGIQEEAPSLGKPVLVMREVTERTEGIEAGTAQLVGTSRQAIIRSTRQLLENRAAYETMAEAINPYGDGTTSKKIVAILNKYDGTL
jgi:UDP-N-acetylglucosamine 2-epimerase (non-hydrolysing)